MEEDRFSDEELILKASSGDMEAFEMLHNKYKARILNYVYRYVGNYQLAEDITQETFIRVYRHLGDYKLVGKVYSWIFKIATNLARNAIRDRRNQPKVSFDDSIILEDSKLELKEIIPDTISQPDKIAIDRESDNNIQNAILSLPLKYREVLILCGCQNLSYKEAAKALSLSVWAIGVRLNRARKMLRKYLKEKGYEL